MSFSDSRKIQVLNNIIAFQALFTDHSQEDTRSQAANKKRQRFASNCRIPLGAGRYKTEPVAATVFFVLCDLVLVGRDNIAGSVIGVGNRFPVVINDAGEAV